MPDKLNFHFPLALLLEQGDKMATAAEANPDLNARLPVGFVADTRDLIATVTTGDATQKADIGDIGTLTLAQNAALTTLQNLVGSAKDTAKRAFKGNDPKLHAEFQVGVNKPTDLASILERAHIVSASLNKAENLPALTAKGWLPSDTTQLDAALTTLAGADGSQETAKSDKLGDTSARNTAANALYENLLTLQNAANLQWPATDPANTALRDKFRLGKFPPRGGSSAPPAPPTPPTPPTPPPA